MPGTATQLYPVSRTADMSTDQLIAVFSFALADAKDAAPVLYDGMDRDDTKATAWRTCADIAIVLHNRADTDDSRARVALRKLAHLL
jgi:hypothetical protein